MEADAGAGEGAGVTVFLSIPFPPSTNRIWRQWKGRTLLSREGRSYRAEVAQLVMLARVPGLGRQAVAMTIDAHMPDARRRDLDNLLKAAQDALQAARVYDDDSQIVDLRIRLAGIDRVRPRLEIKLEAA